MIEISYNAIEFWFCILFIVVCGIQILFYLFFYMRISMIKRKKRPAIQEDPVSVIICARNEEENLKKFLPIFLEQKYSNYEVIVVNDSSEDDSEFVLNDFAKKYPHLRISTIKKDAKFSHGKKLAVTIGIKAARYEKMLFCDADCVPQSDQWLRLMQQSFRDKKEIILGYGGYQQQPGFLDKLIRYDTYSIAVNYMSFAHAGLPYMGVGRNLAYTKNVYEQSSKFSSHYHIKSGDDDLFVSEVGTGENTDIVLDPDSFTRSKQVASFQKWKFQKRRHLTTSHRYKFIHKLLLFLEPFSRELFYLCCIIYCITLPKTMFVAVLTLIGCRMFFFMLATILNCRRLREKDIWFYALFFDIYLPIQIGLLHIKNKFKPINNLW